MTNGSVKKVESIAECSPWEEKHVTTHPEDGQNVSPDLEFVTLIHFDCMLRVNVAMTLTSLGICQVNQD